MSKDEIREILELVAYVDISTKGKLAKFNDWKVNDGSKEGIIALGARPSPVFDPFKITGQTALSFSGGRTSAYMLWRVLQANGGGATGRRRGLLCQHRQGGRRNTAVRPRLRCSLECPYSVDRVSGRRGGVRHG